MTADGYRHFNNLEYSKIQEQKMKDKYWENVLLVHEDQIWHKKHKINTTKTYVVPLINYEADDSKQNKVESY